MTHYLFLVDDNIVLDLGLDQGEDLHPVAAAGQQGQLDLGLANNLMFSH